MGSISVVINTLNEEDNISRAISSIKNLASEIVVVDMNSDDKTVEIAEKMGAKVYQHDRMGYVEPARNYAISKCNMEWILVLDADEIISDNLAKKLKQITISGKADYYRLPRKNIIFGKWIKHSRWWPDYNIRVFKKGFVFWNEIIHSVPTTKGKGLDLKPLEENAIVHNHYDTVEQYIGRMNRYTTYHARNLVNEKYQFNWQDVLVKPSSEFLSRYFKGQGYKDGLHGLALACLQSITELVLYLKIWQSEKFRQENVGLKNVIEKMKDLEGDFHYWQADTLIKEGGGFMEKIKRKLKLP